MQGVGLLGEPKITKKEGSLDEKCDFTQKRGSFGDKISPPQKNMFLHKFG